ncbi:MAG: hypothetical protein H6525_08040 [Actinobacteria bacterium]|nr:hypothetical protein [Actinomycetota bacterium]MCB9412782.1 hypothetical protein [Actinomycetota bacterium]
MDPTRSHRRRWVVAGAAGVVLAGTLGWAASAGAAGSDPTAEELLAALDQPTEESLTGITVTRADLGLPEIPVELLDLPAPFPVDSGVMAAQVWVDGPELQRATVLADPAATAPLAVADTELTAVRNGAAGWLWSAEDATATAFSATPGPTATATPGDLARSFVQTLGPDTGLAVAASDPVAGRPAVALLLTPNNPDTLISRITVTMDAQTNVPLRVQVGSVLTKTPALESEFLSIDYGTPESGVFEFSPPIGATVTDEGGRTESGNGAAIVGDGWSKVAVGPLALPSATDLDSAGGRSQESAQEAYAALISSYLALPTVSGEWGSGRLIEGTLFSAILTDDGRYAIGPVNPTTVEAALNQS